MTHFSNSLEHTKSWYSKIKQKALNAFHALSFAEHLVFYILFAFFAGSSLFLLAKTNEAFTVEVPLEGGTVKEGTVGYPRYINPILSVTDAGKDMSLLIYSGLLKATPQGELVTDLAESYEISDDGLEYTVKLKDDITFHDGTPITTKDVEFTIKKAIDPIIKSPKGAQWQGVVVEIIDEATIKFILKNPYSPFLENLTLGILPEHIWKNVDSEAFLFSQFNFEPVGSGPFKVEEIKRDGSGLPLFYLLSPFKDYALGRPFIEHLYVYFFSNEEKLLKAFLDGTIDNMSGVSPEVAKKVREDRDSTIHQTPLPRIFGLFFNQNEAPALASKEIRLALETAVDRKSIIDNVLSGFATEVTSPLPVFLTGKTDIEQVSKEERIASALSILEKAGWKKNEEGLLEKKDKKTTSKLSFSISTSNAPELKNIAYMLKETWAQLGIDVEVKIFELSDLNQNIIRQRKYDSLLFGEAIGRELDIYAFWHSSERNDPGLNVAMYTNSKVDKVLDELRKTDDETKERTLYETFQKEIQNDIPAIFIYSPDFIYITNKDIKGLELSAITSSSERFLAVEKWYIETQKIWKIFNKQK